MKAKRSLVLVSIAALAGSVVLAGLAPSSAEKSAFVSAPAASAGSFQTVSNVEPPHSLKEIVAPEQRASSKPAPASPDDLLSALPEPPPVDVAVAVDSISGPTPSSSPKKVAVRIIRLAPAPSAPAPDVEASSTVAAKPEPWCGALLEDLNLEEVLLKIETAQ